MSKDKIKVLVLDVDGTMTDGKVYIAENGELFKVFNVKDGLGIHDILPMNNILPVVITGRKSKIMEKRCRELGINFLYQGVSDKVKVLMDFLEKNGYHEEECAYMGDDINDLPCMKVVKIIGCPADAADEIKEIAHFVSKYNGGEGAVRDFIGWLIKDSCYINFERIKR